MEKKLQKIYLTYYNLFIAQDLWQAYYQILLILLLKEFIKLNAKLILFKYKDYDCFLKYTNFKEDLIEYKCLCFNKNNKKSPMKT